MTNEKITDFDILFPDEREKGATRIKQCQLVMLRMLKIFDHLCRKHGIQYFLSGGTMLGCIRHKGFIPWDDDLDVGMTRENYEKFVQCAVPELPNDIFFQNDETDPNYPSFHIMEAKLRDKYSRYSKAKNWHNGLQIDLIVYDRAYLPHNFFIYLLNRLLILCLKNRKDKQRANILKWISRNSPISLVYSCSFIHGLRMIRMGTNYLRAKEIKNLIRANFEGFETFIPVGWHGYLKRRYGNYMQLPRVDLRKGHHSNSNVMQSKDIQKNLKTTMDNLPDPFTPCDHSETLNWTHRMLTEL